MEFTKRTEEEEDPPTLSSANRLPFHYFLHRTIYRLADILILTDELTVLRVVSFQILIRVTLSYRKNIVRSFIVAIPLAIHTHLPFLDAEKANLIQIPYKECAWLTCFLESD